MNDIWLTFRLVRADVVFSVGLVVAACVTWHVLLRKREVASAVGWIGLAWFAPITGAIIYFVFGVNRVQRRARRLRSRVDRRDGRPVRLALPRATTTIWTRWNAAWAASRPGRRCPTMHCRSFTTATRAIRPCWRRLPARKCSVGMSSYIFHDDVWGGKFVEALADAKDRGVEVRVLIDGVGGGWLRSHAYYHLQRRTA